MSDLITVKNLQIKLQNHQNVQSIIGKLNFTIRQGEVFTLLGESGSGKSLTSLALMRLLPLSASLTKDSEIILHQKNLIALSEVEMRKIRGRKMAMIFQEPMTSLNPVFTVGKQIREVLHIHFKIGKKEATERVLILLNEVGLPNPKHIYHMYPHQLSGGMKQRVMIAMALAGEPDLLIADEPTTALDVTTQAQILALLKSLQEKNNMSILLITHDMHVVKKMADQVGVMYAGQLVEMAHRDAFLNDPKHPYSKKLFSCLPNIQKRSSFLSVIPGHVPDLIHELKGCRFANRCQFAWEVCHQVSPSLTSCQDHLIRCHLYTDFGKERVIQDTTVATPIKRNDQNEKNLNKSILSIKDLKIHFPIQKGIMKRRIGWVKAVDGVSLDLKVGKTLALVGESGSGKTTLAKGILHLLQPSSGSMYINEKDVFYLPNRQIKSFRHHTQIVFQDPFSAMDPRMLVGDIIMEGMKALNIGQDKVDRLKRVESLLEQVGLPLDSIYRYPHEFSGGQRQRICIARALAVKPKIIICDEPTSALDVSVQAQILNLLKKLQVEYGLTYLFITHNIAVVSYLADEIAVMYQGKIVEYGAAESILNDPQHVYTKLLLRAAIGA